jgi:hypothetical protein
MILVQRFEFAPEATDQVEEGTGDTNIRSKSVKMLRSNLNSTPGVLLSQKAVVAVNFSRKHSISLKNGQNGNRIRLPRLVTASSQYW